MTAKQVVLVSHDAGGTVPPMVALAHAFLAAGHEVTVLGQPVIGARAEAAGCRFVPFSGLGDYATDRSLEEQFELSLAVITGPTPGDDLLALASERPPDVVVVDCNLAGAAAAAETLDATTALLLHSMYRTLVDTWFAQYWPFMEPGVNRTRERFGLGPCRSWADVFVAHDRLVAVVPEIFDAPVAGAPDAQRHYGFLLPPAPADDATVPPLPPGSDPLVLASLSTTYQRQEDLLARIVEALGRLPVRGLVTTGIDVPGLPDAPANVAVHRYVPHQAVLDRTDLVLTHAGMGTVAGALHHGIPLVCTPIDRDQPLNASRVAELGAGTTLGPDASVDELASAVEGVLGDPSYRAAAGAVADASRTAGGAAAAVADLTDLATR